MNIKALDAARPAASRSELTLPGVVLGATSTIVVIAAIFLGLSAVAGSHGESNAEWLARVPDDPIARVQWILSDLSEPQFYSSWISSIGLLLGAFLGWFLQKRKLVIGGQGIAYGSGLWLWTLGAATLSLLLSNALFGASLKDGWQPTFVPFVCVAAAIVLIYGRGWAILFTGAILGAFTTPLAMFLIAFVSEPMGLPSVVANTLAMSLGAALAFLLVRTLPWMKLPTPTDEAAPVPVRATHTLVSDAWWTVRRILCDFTEAQFWATEWASIGLLVGAALAVLITPLDASFGSQLLPQIVIAQVLASGVGVVVWRHLYRGGGWAPTYIVVVSVAPATVLAYGGGPIAIVAGAVAGALLCPLIALAVSRRLPADFHPFIGNTFSMAASTALIVPAVGLIPGIG